MNACDLRNDFGKQSQEEHNAVLQRLAHAT
jgi:hypothetical protein